MKFGNTTTVLQLFRTWVNQEALHEANSLYAFAWRMQQSSNLQFVLKLYLQAQWARGNWLTAAGAIDELRNSICLNIQSEWRSQTEEAWMGNQGIGKGILNLFMFTILAHLPISGVVLYLIILHWSLSIADRQAWLQRVPSQEFSVFRREKSFLSESPSSKQNKTQMTSWTLRCRQFVQQVI